VHGVAARGPDCPRERRSDGGTNTPGTAGDYGDAGVHAIHGRLLEDCEGSGGQGREIRVDLVIAGKPAPKPRNVGGGEGGSTG
jgi:hypothetical protein